MNKNLIAAFGLGALLAGMAGYLASGPSKVPATQEIVVAQVTEPQKETLPAEGEAPKKQEPVIEEPHKQPKTVYNPEPKAPARAADKPAPRRARAADVEIRKPAPAGAQAPVLSGESPRVEAAPVPVVAPPPSPSAPVQNEPKAEILRPDPIAPAPKKREPQTVVIKEGTVIAIRTSELLSSERQQSGDTFNAALADPIIVDGFVLAERGSRVTGRIVEAQAAGKVKGVARLSIELTQVSLIDGQKLQLATDPFLREGATSRKSDAAKIGAGAAIGAALGGIFGGGKGAAIGGAAGAGAGGGAVVLTRGKPVEIESESRLPFRVSRSLTVTEKL